MRALFIFTGILSMLSWHSGHSNSPGLTISAENPNYYEYNGHPTIIISATEHYFAVVNSKFDYNIYLNRLHSLGLNMASIMSGVFLEPHGQGETPVSHPEFSIRYCIKDQKNLINSLQFDNSVAHRLWFVKRQFKNQSVNN